MSRPTCETREATKHSLLRRESRAKAPVCYTNFMKRDEAISRLQQHEADLNRAARPRTIPTLNLFFDYEKGKLGLFELMVAASNRLGSR